jgi:sucrose-6-phosphate hydrolase SacC (GH32 family)
MYFFLFFIGALTALAFERPQYHVVPPLGHWMNDPNGPFYDEDTGIYHLFYQFNPYGFTWGNMSWAHVYSQDLIHWTPLPVALYPDEPYDDEGVFSGSIYRQRGKMPIIYYTCVDSEQRQRQCQAVPSLVEGRENLYESWRKAPDNPIVSRPPQNGPYYDQFRDPALYVEVEEVEDILQREKYEHGTSSEEGREREIMIVAAQVDEYTGVVAKYQYGAEGKEGEDEVSHWAYIGDLWTTQHSSNPDAASESMVECPDFFSVSTDGSSSGAGEQGESPYILKYSLMNTRRDYYEVGAYVDGLFRPYAGKSYHKVDYGVPFAYYASKTFWDNSLPNGRRLQWGWASETDGNSDGRRHWAGVMSLPRVVTYDEEGGFLRYNVIPEVHSLHGAQLYSGEHIFKLGTILPGRNNTLRILPLQTSSSQAYVRVQWDITTVMLGQRSGLSGPTVDVGVSICGCGVNRTLVGFRLDPVGSVVSTLIDTSYSGGTTPPTTEVNALPFERLSASTREDAYKALVLEIYIDQSMIEAFSSGGMHASTLRVYSSHSDCDAIELFVRESSMDAIAYKEANVPVAVDIHSISSLG